MRLAGVGAAPGFAFGPMWRHVQRQAPAALAVGAVDPDAIAAVAAAQLEAIGAQLRDAGRPDEAAIFDAQAMMATDPTLTDEWRRRLEAGEDPLAALDAATGEAAAMLASLGDELLAARATDVRDVGSRLRRIVTGEGLDLPAEPSIVVAEDLPPSTAAEIPPGLLLGIALEAGSKTAHAAILARGLGIPCIVGVDGLLAAVDQALATDGATTPGHVPPVEMAVDGAAGLVYTLPTADELAALRERREAAFHQGEIARGFRDRPAATKDGHRVRLVANIGTPADVPRALEARAEGVGLFRTEFLFMGRQSPPTEDEQVEAYREVFEAFGPDRPVVVRLADIGGDKGIPYLHLPHEENPFLGVRALRLAYPDRRAGRPEHGASYGMLVTQLRAVSTAAAQAGVVPHVMAPMVATEADVELLHALRDEAQAGLAREGMPRSERIVTGIMVEIPSAALIADRLMRHVDFFSIGTNDLTQYLLAADRTNPALATLQDALHPAVLRCIRMVTGAAGAAGKPVAVCGELAGDPAGALVLVGLGVDELSADAGSLDALRYRLAGVTDEQLRHLAARALDARDAEEVRALANDLVEGRAPVATPGPRAG